jgi:hypothetical protein
VKYLTDRIRVTCLFGILLVAALATDLLPMLPNVSFLTPDQQAAADRRQCISYGFYEGTGTYTRCIDHLRHARAHR